MIYKMKQIDLTKYEATHKENGVIILNPKKRPFPESWYALRDIGGEFVDSLSSSVRYEGSLSSIHNNRNTVPKGYGKPLLALTQLLQIRQRYWEIDGFPDWENYEVRKWCVDLDRGKWDISGWTYHSQLFSFTTEEAAQHFLEHHIDLLNELKPMFVGVKEEE